MAIITALPSTYASTASPSGWQSGMTPERRFRVEGDQGAVEVSARSETVAVIRAGLLGYGARRVVCL